VADCLPEKDAILDLAARYGLLTVSLTKAFAPGQPVPSTALPPEPLAVWCRQIRELKPATDLWDRINAGDLRGRDLLDRRLSANLAGAISFESLSPQRLSLPDALPTRHSAHPSLSTARQRSDGTASVRPLSRASLWPLVPQEPCLQK
jgi:hypothetical protein